MITRVLRRGARGDDVEQWQLFLIGQELDPGTADGAFGAATLTATVEFQKKNSLDADGVVGRGTLTRALSLGFGSLDDPDDQDEKGPNWPPPPDFRPLTSTTARQGLFGAFRFTASPQPGNREAITLLGDWEAENIVSVTIPQLKGVKGAPSSGTIRCHRLVKDQLAALFAAWERAGVLDRILTWGGSFVPRFIRGSDTTLSNHSFGSAFDINAQWNGFGAEPALVGRKGSVRELVEIANDHGFYWGGHYRRRRDGMHFEVSSIKEFPPSEGVAASFGEEETVLKLPMAREALPGSKFFEQIRGTVGAAREDAIFAAITAGQVPDSLRAFREVTLSAPGSDGKMHAGVIWVLSDYLAVGTDDDAFRVPMYPLTAQRIADACGCHLPTKRLVDVIYAQAGLKLRPQPLPVGPKMTSSDYYYRHHQKIEAQRAGQGAGAIVAGHKKDIVITNRLKWKPKNVAIYGWHQPNGAPIQPLSTVHQNTYVDYSHGVRLIHATMVVDGEDRSVAEVLKDPVLSSLLSDEGPQDSARVPGVEQKAAV